MQRLTAAWPHSTILQRISTLKKYRSSKTLDVYFGGNLTMNAPLSFLLSTIESDCHSWNLIYLQLMLQEQNVDVINLGPCVPHRQTVEAIRTYRPDAVVISTVNGHGCVQAKVLSARARAELGNSVPPLIIGGKLSTHEADHDLVRRELTAAGFDAVFAGSCSIEEFSAWLAAFRASRVQYIPRPAHSRLRGKVLQAKNLSL